MLRFVAKFKKLHWIFASRTRDLHFRPRLNQIHKLTLSLSGSLIVALDAGDDLGWNHSEGANADGQKFKSIS